MIYPRLHLAVGGLCVAILAAFTAAAVGAPAVPPLGVAALAGLTLAAALGVLRGWQARIDVWPEGVAWRTWRGGWDRMAWDEVEALVWSRSWKQYQLIAGRRSCAVPLAMTGQADFARAALAHVPEARIDDRALAFLTLAARGA